ncbi:cell division protein FtsQ/DivIB [Lachnobacterium bovis]|uniref:cell division protein FtsQ/DivIB n=1 Tax=Lachnobacterium bovis TaxID=140626 RepID=UPI0003B56562|nr:FtsQ-type POTRA domain-containing protein [Lachnobacterium bovis]
MQKKRRFEEAEDFSLENITIDNIEESQEGTKSKAKSKEKNFNAIPKPLKIFVGIAMVLLIIFIVLCSSFKLKKVEIEGNTLYDNEKIKKVVLNDGNSWNTLYVFLKYRMTKTKAVPFVDKIEVNMVNATTLKVHVSEKEILGYIYIPAINSNAYFDKDGIVVELSQRIIPNVPKVDGLSCAKVVQYEKLPVSSKKLDDLLALTRSLKKYKIPPDLISYSKEDTPNLKYKDIDVPLGKTLEYTPKIERLCQILKSLNNLKGVLHLEKWNYGDSNIIFEKTQ